METHFNTLAPRKARPGQCLTDARAADAELGTDDRLPAGAKGAVVDGRAGAAVVRHGGSYPRRTASGRERNQRASQSRLGDRTVSLGYLALRVVLRLALADRRLPEGDVRSSPLADVPAR